VVGIEEFSFIWVRSVKLGIATYNLKKAVGECESRVLEEYRKGRERVVREGLDIRYMSKLAR